MKLFPVGALLFTLPFAICRAQEIKGISGSAAPTPGGARPAAVQLTGYEYVVPELIVGGEWTSTIVLTNQGTVPTPSTNVFFYDDLGNPLKATFQTSNGNVVTDTGFSFSLPVGTTLETTFVGTSAVRFGHAVVDCNSTGCSLPGLYGEVTLRNRNSTRPDFESIFPFETPNSLQYMLFDGRFGYTTTLYLVNESANPTTISIDVVDSLNRLLRTVNIPFLALQSQILSLHVLSQETIGAFGTLIIRSPSSKVLVTATGLRVNPSNSFTPLRAFVPAQ